MIRYLLVFGVVLLYFFFSSLPFTADHFFFAITGKFTRHPKPIHAVLHAVLLVGAKVALGIAQVVHGIQQVGLATAICPCNTRYRGRKTEPRRRIITKLDKRYFINTAQRDG